MQRKHWAKVPVNEISKTLFETIEKIKTNDDLRTNRYSSFYSLYNNDNIKSLTPYAYYKPDVYSDSLNFNVVKQCVDTLCAKISKSKSKPRFLTEDGNYSLKRRAENLTQYIGGLFRTEKVYEEMQKSFRDSAIFGTGCVKVFASDDQVRFERVFPGEILVHHEECFNAKPRHLYQRKLVERDVLISMFPEMRNEIEAAERFQDITYKNTYTELDLVEVVEAWQLGAKDMKGKRVIAIKKAVLFEEDYEKSYFPFVFLRFSEPVSGFFGTSLTQELEGLQAKIQKTLENIDQAQELMSVPRVFVDKASNVSEDDIDNEIGKIIYHDGPAPQMQTAQAMTPEIYSFLENLFRKAFEITGISLMEATSQVPRGLESGVALRTYEAQTSVRFSLIAQKYEQAFLDLAKIAIDISKEIYSSNKNLSVKVPGRNFIKNIKWKNVDLTQDQFVMDVFPESMLPSTPAGRLQTVTDLMQAGFIDKSDALSLLDFPDTEKFNNLHTASLDLVERMIENMIENAAYIPPEPYIDLNKALQLTQQSYLKAQLDDVAEDRLELLRTFMEDIQSLLTPSPEEQLEGQLGGNNNNPRNQALMNRQVPPDSE